LNLLPSDFSYKFILGGPTSSVLEDREDELWFNLSDKFTDIAPKVAAGCRWALDHGFEKIFICDDDTYVVPQRLLEAVPNADYVGWFRPDGGDPYPLPYIQGSAFWLSSKAAKIVAYSREMKNGVPDDVAVGRALYGHVGFYHDGRYEPGPLYYQRYPRRSNNVITTHKCIGPDMFEMHKFWMAECES
jgi:hypothetical protein